MDVPRDLTGWPGGTTDGRDINQEGLAAERSRLVDLLAWYESGEFGSFGDAAAGRAWALRVRIAEIDQKLAAGE